MMREPMRAAPTPSDLHDEVTLLREAISEALRQISRADYTQARKVLHATLPEVRRVLKLCGSVRLDDLDGYLRRTGWSLIESSPFHRRYTLPGGVRWLDHEPTEAGLITPVSPDVDAYAEEILRAVGVVARAERRSTEDILADINASGAKKEAHFAIGSRVEVIRSEDGPAARRVFKGMEGRVVAGRREYPGCVQVEFRDEDGEEEPRSFAVNVALLRLMSENEP